MPRRAFWTINHSLSLIVFLGFLDYYDKYGAPATREDSWEEGYHVIEKKLAEYYNHVKDNGLDFPLIAGMAGGVHLYKPLHGRKGDEPWNITGWIPRQKRWLSQGEFYTNRLSHFSQMCFPVTQADFHFPSAFMAIFHFNCIIYRNVSSKILNFKISPSAFFLQNGFFVDCFGLH